MKAEKTLYEKRGRRYFPVADHVAWDSWCEGTYLVSVRPGSRGWRRTVNPSAAAVLAVLRNNEEAIIGKITDLATIRPSGQLTGLELDAWNAYRKVAGQDATILLTVPSPGSIYNGLVDFIESLVPKAKKGGRK